MHNETKQQHLDCVCEHTHKKKDDDSWWQPQEVHPGQEPTFPPEALALRQLYIQGLWDIILGPNWQKECVVHANRDM